MKALRHLEQMVLGFIFQARRKHYAVPSKLLKVNE